MPEHQQLETKVTANAKKTSNTSSMGGKVMRDPWFIRLTTRQVDVLNQVKLFYIKNSRLPTGKELGKNLGASKGTGDTFMRLFREIGIIKSVPGKNEWRWVRIPYKVVDCGRISVERYQDR